MGEYAIKGLEETSQFGVTGQQKHAETALQIEGALNNLDKEITEYLVKIASGNLSENESTIHSTLMDTIRDIEKIVDHFENVIELIEYKITNRINITKHEHEDKKENLDITI